MKKETSLLLNQEQVDKEYVIAELHKQKSGTEWATKTNDWAIAQIEKVAEGVWVKGLLPEEYFLKIILRKHRHTTDKTSQDIFLLENEDISISEARDIFEQASRYHHPECIEHVEYLKGEIREKGFTSSVVLNEEGGELKHLDGLHRLLALSLLLKEGYNYQPVPVLINIK